MDEALRELHSALNQNRINLEFDGESAVLILPDGSRITFVAEGYEGTHLEINAEIKKKICIRVGG